MVLQPLPTPRYSVGEDIVTEFLRGSILDIIDGREKHEGWRDTYYYRIWISKFRVSHIVREDEIILSRRLT